MDGLVGRLSEFAGNGVCRYGFDDGIVLHASSGFLQHLDADCTPDEAVGKPLRELLGPEGRADLLQKALAETGELRGYVHRFRTLKGAEKSLLCDAFVSEEPARIVNACVRDITGLIRAQAALARERNLMRTLIDNLPDCAYFKDAESRFVVANEAVARLMGAADGNALLGKTDFDFYPKDLADRYYADERGVISTGQALVGREEPCVDAEGGARWLSTTKKPIRNAEGRVVGLVGFGRDITKHRRVEEALLEALQRFEAVVENTPLVAIQGFDQFGYIRHWNGACASLYGFRREEALGRRVQDLLLNEQEARHFEQVLEQVWASGAPTIPEEWCVRRRDGVERWVYSSIFPVSEHGKVVEAFCMDVDVTERRRTEEALRLDEMRLEALLKLDQMADAPLREITDFALEEAVRLAGSSLGYLAFLNDDETVMQMYSWSRAAMEECMLAEKPLVYPLETAGLWGEAVRQRRPIITNDYVAETQWKKGYPAGHVEIRRHMNVPVFEGNRIVLVAGVGNKATEYDESDVRQLTLLMTGMWRLIQRKQAADALRESEAKYHTLFEIFPMSLFLEDFDGRIVECNGLACEMYGYGRDELLSLSAPDLLAEPPRPRRKGESAEEAFETGTIAESLGRRKSGEFFPTQVSTQVVNIGGERMVLRRVLDVTDLKRTEEGRKRLEAQMQQSQKLESLGVLAGGIAHDFNNLLTGILGHATLVLMELSQNSPMTESMKQIEITARRAAELTGQMLAYSGRGRFVVQSVQLSDVIQEMGHLLEISISKKCALKYNFLPGLPLIEADVAQLRQVIMNLIINASEAIGDRSGEILLSTGTIHCDSAFLGDTYVNDSLPEGLYVYLDVTDTGCGMTPEIQARLFDPFFTTKFTGRGLGLAALLGIVRGHHGAVKVNSEVGRGTTFRVLFPAAQGPARIAQELAAEEEAYCGTGTILIVDDEEIVRELGREVLRDAGFSVMLACDGREALDVFRANAGEIRAVVLDLTMPHMDGVETFAEMKRIRDDVRVILSSGYNEQDAMERFAGQGLAGFIHKPYCATDLTRLVYKVACEPKREPKAARKSSAPKGERKKPGGTK